MMLYLVGDFYCSFEENHVEKFIAIEDVTIVAVTTIFSTNVCFKGGRTWILCGSKGMYMARLRGSVSGNLKHVTAARVYIAELAGDRL